MGMEEAIAEIKALREHDEKMLEEKKRDVMANMKKLKEEMSNYKTQTLQMIRERKGRLDEKTDDELADLYSQWSEETASAGWLMHWGRSIDAFYEWATTAPCDRKKEKT